MKRTVSKGRLPDMFVDDSVDGGKPFRTYFFFFGELPKEI